MKIPSTIKKSEPPKDIVLQSEDSNPILRITLQDNTNHELEPYMKSIYFSESAYQDYYTFRALYLTGNQFFIISKLVKTAGDCIEKLLKLFLLSYNPNIDVKNFSHSLNKLRETCEGIDNYYQNPILKTFCNEYSQKIKGVNGHQIFGYSDTSVINRIEVDWLKILNLLDETYLETLIRMNNYEGLNSSDIFAIYLNRGTAISRYKEIFNDVRNIFFSKNEYIDDFYRKNKKIIEKHTIPL
ncbi:hypothetical protein [Flavobacterium sp.]|uniref:hypothetical protein n=1 Tax=Flavobacterium sp. TaxID=239 RepID=UPI0039E56616